MCDCRRNLGRGRGRRADAANLLPTHAATRRLAGSWRSDAADLPAAAAAWRCGHAADLLPTRCWPGTGLPDATNPFAAATASRRWRATGDLAGSGRADASDRDPTAGTAWFSDASDSAHRVARAPAGCPDAPDRPRRAGRAARRRLHRAVDSRAGLCRPPGGRPDPASDRANARPEGVNAGGATVVGGARGRRADRGPRPARAVDRVSDGRAE